ncbi:hypothetical protein TWF569_008100 [Orbilia oligospora]|uniref:Uncharacterized protein n=1 Tax=Orbilia oligospora TaxID=2813651 RepID=A0A7C8NLQ7_ORBOL|nr:hypothetical protein TWF706_009100 [Orbilia oligospora]KAF3100265.1 hypothetical protein TWF103_008286 [Orbilia oligospora]KAF3112664.1 hypothetical protein TWF102_004066 [Orbilia oligospora]KAF3120031.1 hypothetical protein TWF594_004411 [Orbilia oligospora]KAF3141218.1 hypothetical protein TWF569_008100 [Orbilia oligospora]
MASTEIQPGPRSLRRESMKLTQRSQSFDYRIRRRNIFEEVATAKVAAMREAKLPKDSARTLGTSIPRKRKLKPRELQSESPEYLESVSDGTGFQNGTESKFLRIVGYIPRGIKLVGVVIFNVFRIMCILDESQPHSPQLGPDPNSNNAPGDPQKGTPTKRSRRKW